MKRGWSNAHLACIKPSLSNTFSSLSMGQYQVECACSSDGTHDKNILETGIKEF